jgi:hypothetical protein
MKKKALVKKLLTLNVETIRQLSPSHLLHVIGGGELTTTSDNCSAYQTCTKP